MHMTQAESAILVAEDNEDIRELVAHQAAAHGIHVLQADNGARQWNSRSPSNLRWS
jgi:CheY-like chemotaxis protein